MASNADLVAQVDGSDLPVGEPHASFVAIGDGVIGVEAPASWNESRVTGFLVGPGDGEMIGRIATAAPSLRALLQTNAGNGVFTGGSQLIEEDLGKFVDREYPGLWGSCATTGRGDYTSPEWVGVYEVYGPCGEGPVKIIVKAVRSTSDDRVSITQLWLTSQADREAAQRILDSISYTPPPLQPEDLVTP